MHHFTRQFLLWSFEAVLALNIRRRHKFAGILISMLLGTGGVQAGQIIGMLPISAWTNLASGLNGPAYSLAVDPNDNLYAGGAFTTVGDVAATNIAQWDGSNWSALSSGISGGGPGVRSLAVAPNGNLYAGGMFVTAGGVAATNIAKWNGSNWSALRSGINGHGVWSLAVAPNGNLYAGGAFTTAGGVMATNIAKWNGSNWTALSSGISGPSVYSLAMAPNGVLYAGGRFVTAGGVIATNIAKWSGSSWSALSSGISGGPVFSLAVTPNGNVYAGGVFTTAGGVMATNIAQWNGSNWSALSSGINGSVQSLAVDSNNNLYAGGSFTMAGGVAATNIAQWNGTNWSAMSSGLDGPGVQSLAVAPNGVLYAGGTFVTAGGDSVESGIAKWGPVQVPCTGVNPSSGRTTGGYAVTITGLELGSGTDITNVTLCGVSATSIVSQSATQVVIVAGTGSNGTGDVVVYSASCGTSVASNAFTYIDLTFKKNSDNTITITGYTGTGGVVNITNKINGLIVTSIGTNAFRYCNNLTSVTIPSSVTNIGISAFGQCFNLTNVAIQNGVTSIGDGAFFDCHSLANLTVPGSVTNIGSYLFYNCTSLTSVTIPASVASIGDMAFVGCTALVNIFFQGNAPNLLGPQVFYGDINATIYYFSGTTGWDTFSGSTPILWNPQTLNDATFGIHTNCFGFTFTNAGSPTVIVAACTNLTNPVWTPISTNTLTTGSSYFSDPQWTNFPNRFYRFQMP